MFPASLSAAKCLVWTWKRRNDFPLLDSNLQICSRFFLIYVRISTDIYRSVDQEQIYVCSEVSELSYCHAVDKAFHMVLSIFLFECSKSRA
jgi:hypothetical protein